MRALTTQQQRLCSFVGSYRERNGVSPIYAEIGAHLGVTKQAVQYQVKALVALGYLQKPHGARSLMTSDIWQRHRRHQLDRETNPMICLVAEESPRLFDEFSENDWETLYSTRGVGGALTREGVAAVAERINENRDFQQRAAELLENSGVRQELMVVIDSLWSRVALAPGKPRSTGNKAESPPAQQH